MNDELPHHPFNRGDAVVKLTGYAFPGVVVSAYFTLRGEPRVVVECTIPGCQGMQHIFSPSQLRKVE